jgi:hypothetical protein
VPDAGAVSDSAVGAAATTVVLGIVAPHTEDDGGLFKSPP